MNGEKAGFPRFQGLGRYHSFTYKAYGNDALVLILAKIGRILVRWSRPVEGIIKTVTVSREADGWYISCSCSHVPTQPLRPTGKETDLDVGLKVFLITAEGAAAENPRHYCKAEKRLTKAQRRHVRRKRGGKRRERGGCRLLSSTRKSGDTGATSATRPRSPSCTRTTSSYLEDLRVANLVRIRHRAKSISDAG
jgi:putative transposase